MNYGRSSSLSAVLQAPERRLEWANDVRFHVSRHLLHLRRFRKVSQAKLAKSIGASQSQIARVESGEENVTASTVERIVTALDGRFEVRIAPSEMPLRSHHLWWETKPAASTAPWTLDVVETKVEPDRLEVRLTFGADRTGTLVAPSLFIEAGAR